MRRKVIKRFTILLSCLRRKYLKSRYRLCCMIFVLQREKKTRDISIGYFLSIVRFYQRIIVRILPLCVRFVFNLLKESMKQEKWIISKQFISMRDSCTIYLTIEFIIAMRRKVFFLIIQLCLSHIYIYFFFDFTDEDWQTYERIMRHPWKFLF